MTHAQPPPNQLPPNQPTWDQVPRPDPDLPNPGVYEKRPPKQKRFGWPTVLITAFGSWLIGLLMGIAGMTPTGELSAPVTERVVVTATVTPQAPPTNTASKPKPAPEPKAAGTMGEGTYEIGVDAPAGRYKTKAEDSCYWERTKDDSGSLNSILANANVNDGALASVTVKRGEFFTSSGCGTWTKVS